MASDDVTRGEEETSSINEINETEIRKKAVKRSWICPGAGFALVGNGALATVTFLTQLCVLPAVAWLAFRPSAESLWTTIAICGVAIAMWLVEQVLIRKAAPRAPRPALLVRGVVASTCALAVVAILAIGLLFTGFGSLRMAGAAMAPTLENHERLIYHKHVDWQAVKPGAIVVYKNASDSAWGQPGWIVISRIVAGPGDEIARQDGKYVVSGVAGPAVGRTGEHEIVLDIPSSPQSLTVPDECYFIVTDSPTSGLDSRVLSWVRAEDILGSRIWYLSRRGIFKPVE